MSSEPQFIKWSRSRGTRTLPASVLALLLVLAFSNSRCGGCKLTEMVNKVEYISKFATNVKVYTNSILMQYNIRNRYC